MNNINSMNHNNLTIYLRMQKMRDAIIAKLKAKIAKKGIYENAGQNEYINFKDKVNADDYLSYAEKSELCEELMERINLIN